MPVIRGGTVPRAQDYSAELKSATDLTIFNTRVGLMPNVLQIVKERSGATAVYACADNRPFDFLVAANTNPVKAVGEPGDEPSGEIWVPDFAKIDRVHALLEEAASAATDPTRLAEFITGRTALVVDPQPLNISDLAAHE